MWCRNVEGYSDYTAGIAIRRASKKEREEGPKMAKKRSCRRSTNENKTHEKAVKVRKMTDEQLVEYIENRVAKAKSEGYNEGKKKGYDVGYLVGSKDASTPLEPVSKVFEFLESLCVNKIQGVGKATVDKLKIHAKEGGYLG